MVDSDTIVLLFANRTGIINCSGYEDVVHLGAKDRKRGFNDVVAKWTWRLHPLRSAWGSYDWKSDGLLAFWRSTITPTDRTEESGGCTLGGAVSLEQNRARGLMIPTSQSKIQTKIRNTLYMVLSLYTVNPFWSRLCPTSGCMLRGFIPFRLHSYMFSLWNRSSSYRNRFVGWTSMLVVTMESLMFLS